MVHLSSLIHIVQGNIRYAFYNAGRHICCGYEDGVVRVWDLRECSTTCSMSPSHSGPVNCLTVHRDGATMMTGSEDATARLVSTTTGKVCANDSE